jgi:hypothetical protein
MGRGLAGIAVAAVLASCATQGHVYDRAESDNFEIGVTTAEQVMTALGPPDLDLLRPDGMRILRWRYRILRGLSVEEHVLSANFNTAGMLIYLHNPEEGQQISPF